MKVVKYHQDLKDEDGFPAIFVMDNGSIVLTSEKRGIWLDGLGLTVLESTYKAGFENPDVQQAMTNIADSVIEGVVDFDPVCQILYNRIMA